MIADAGTLTAAQQAAISVGTGAVAGGAAGLLGTWLNWRYQRRLWGAEARQRGVERREERVRDVLRAVLTYVQLLDVSAHAARLHQDDEADKQFTEAQGSSATSLTSSVRTVTTTLDDDGSGSRLLTPSGPCGPIDRACEMHHTPMP